MESVKYIFAEPENVDGISIYPVQMINYDEFMNVANILTISYDSFSNEDDSLNDIKLLDLVLMLYMELKQVDIVIDSFEKLFSFVCRKTVKFNPSDATFVSEDESIVVNRDNYDQIRNILLRQNLIFTPKVYKDPLTQKRAEKVIKHRAKSSMNISIESMIAVLALSGIPLGEIKTYSIYTLKTLFQYKLKYENYKTMMLFKTVDTSGNINPEHFAEEIDMLANPYADLFKKKSSFANLKQAGFDLDKAK